MPVNIRLYFAAFKIAIIGLSKYVTDFVGTRNQKYLVFQTNDCPKCILASIIKIQFRTEKKRKKKALNASEINQIRLLQERHVKLFLSKIMSSNNYICIKTKNLTGKPAYVC